MHDYPKGDLVKLLRGLMSEAEARAMLERIRFPDGLHCIFPDCGGAEVYRIEVAGKVYKKADGSERIVHPRHLFKCKACKRQFSVTKGTIFEDSKIPLTVWITVMYRMCSSKKGVSAYQIHREYGLTYEAAWFMCHRIRWSMTEKDPTLLAGVIEADETYVRGKVRGHVKQRREYAPPRRCGLPDMYVPEQAYRHNTREIKDVERFTALLGQVEGRLDWYVGKQVSSE